MKPLLISLIVASICMTNCIPNNSDESDQNYPIDTTTSFTGIKIASPIPGDRIRRGTHLEMVIRSDGDYGTVIELSVDNGKHWLTINQSSQVDLVEGVNRYAFAIPDSIEISDWVDGMTVSTKVSTVTDKALLKVFEYTAQDPSYVMSGPFQIIAK